MGFSINTNVNAMAALQSMNKTNKSLDQVQSRVSTGLKVASTKDDSATFVNAQNLRAKVSDLKAVTSSLTNAKSVVDVAVSGVEQISDAINTMKTLAKQAGDETVSASQRKSLDKDFQAQISQISTIINSSEFNGVNLLKTPGAGEIGKVTALQSLTNTGTPPAYAPDTMVVNNLDMTLDTAADPTNAKLTSVSSLSDAATAQKLTAALDKYVSDDSTGLNKKLSDLGSAARKIDAQLAFTSKLNDTLESGIGNLVDADMAKESARLSALQTKQQLGMQALSIANQGPQSIGQLFRG